MSNSDIVNRSGKEKMVDSELVSDPNRIISYVADEVVRLEKAKAAAHTQEEIEGIQDLETLVEQTGITMAAELEVEESKSKS